MRIRVGTCTRTSRTPAYSLQFSAVQRHPLIQETNGSISPAAHLKKNQIFFWHSFGLKTFSFVFAVRVGRQSSTNEKKRKRKRSTPFLHQSHRFVFLPYTYIYEGFLLPGWDGRVAQTKKKCGANDRHHFRTNCTI